MSAATNRINALAPRVLPFAAGLVVVLIGFSWWVQPGITDYRRVRAEAQTLEARVHILEDTIARNRQAAQPDPAQALALFEQRVSKQDCVADIIERLSRAVTESATDGKLRNLAIGTGDQTEPGASGTASATEGGEAETIDPRWNLFPYRVTHTAVRLSFDASYATIVGFVSKIRDLPTAIEIRSLRLTRGLPLMSAELTLYVFRRADLLPEAGAAAPLRPPAGAPWLSGPEESPANPLVPRVIEPRGPKG